MVMPKLTVIILIALVVDVIAFIGLGFGTGALSTTTTDNTSYLPSWSNDSAGGAGGSLEPDVYVQMGTLPFVSSMLGAPSQGSTLSFGMYPKTNTNCGGAGRPAYDAAGANPAYYEIQFIQNGVAQRATFSVDGQQVTNSAVFPTNNNTQTPASGSGTTHNPYFYACLVNGVNGFAGNLHTNNFEQPVFFHTVALVGLVGTGTLKITYFANGPLCSGSVFFGTTGNVCIAGEGLLNAAAGSASGTWASSSSVSVPVLNGQASASPVGGGPWFNNGTISFQLNTGYGGAGGYSLQVNNPGVRGGGVASWPGNPQTVGNNIVNGVFTFNIPTGASTACTTNGCNEFTVNLYSPAVRGTLSFGVDISPAYVPGTPTITYATSSGSYYPKAGDTVTLTFTAHGSPTNQSVNTILIFVYYLLPGGVANGTQPCGQNYVTPCSGIFLNVTTTGSGQAAVYTATYSFTVNPPVSTVAIGVQAQSETKIQQSSALNFYTISVAPLDCVPGAKCNPSANNAAIWHFWGPILLILAIVLVTVLFLLIVRLPIYATAGIVVIEVLAFVVLYSTLSSQFVPGGAFG